MPFDLLAESDSKSRRLAEVSSRVARALYVSCSHRASELLELSGYHLDLYSTRLARLTWLLVTSASAMTESPHAAT